jgi:serpin B
MGMKLPFLGTADFDGMLKEEYRGEEKFISQIRHQAVLEVDEEGTRATAATATEIVDAAVEEPFHADRPFLVLLVEQETNAILFMGRVTNPLE